MMGFIVCSLSNSVVDRLFPQTKRLTSDRVLFFWDNKYYYSDCLVLLKVLENKHAETYKIEGLAYII